MFDSRDSSPQGDEQETVPARMLNELAYCPRLFHLEWVQSEWAPNSDTLAGERQHARHDRPRGRVPQPEVERSPEDPGVEATSVWLSAPELGISAKIDLLKDEHGGLVPIEFKRGKGPREGGVWEPDRVQLGAQMLVLRANGYTCDHGWIAYRDARRRERVELSAELATEVLALRDRALELARTPKPPPPLVDSPKCPRCSLVTICLPDEVHRLADLHRRLGATPPESLPESPAEASHPDLPRGELNAPSTEAEQGGGPFAGLSGSTEGSAGDQDLDSPDTLAEPTDGVPLPVRRLFAPRISAQPLVVQRYGSRIGREDELLVIQPLDDAPTRVPLLDVSEVSLFGNVQISTQAMTACFHAGIPIAFFSVGGWFQGLATAPGGGNALRRLEQYRFCTDAPRSLQAARELIHRKIRNSRTLLRRNSRQEVREPLSSLWDLSLRVLEAPDLGALLGLEGLAAKAYFAAFPAMFTSAPLDFDFTSRNRRPPKDPINALLSLAYSMLARDWTGALHAVGADPYCGFFHRFKHGKPALALDLMEEFRPLVADSTVIQVLNNGEIDARHFLRRGPACSLTDVGRRKFLEAYARRLEQEVRHPLLGYTLSYRRLLLVQARLFTRFCAGELDAYPGFQTR